MTELTTIFKAFSTPVENIHLREIADLIRSDRFKFEIEEIQTLITQGLLEEAQEKKKELLAFTPSATFNGRRLPNHLDEYSGFIHLDFDNLSPDQLEAVFEIFSEDYYTFLCFRSPSGNGLKVFVHVTTGAEHHDIAYAQVMEYYESITGLKADRKCKDIARLCFMSYDPNLYIEILSMQFMVFLPDSLSQLQSTMEPVEGLNEADVYDNLLSECVRFTKQKKNYTIGERNDFIYLFASNCNRTGIPLNVVRPYAMEIFDLPKKEIDGILKSAYTHHAYEHAKFAKSANKLKPEQVYEGAKSANPAKSEIIEEQKPDEDYLKSTPLIPESLYLQMPQIIRDGAMAFTELRERDVFLTGALGILSGCLPGVKGIYAGQEVFPNLFSFIVAPAASGKGALKFAKMLADEYHNAVLKTSREAETCYKQELSEYKQKISNKKRGNATTEEAPTTPIFKVVFIPANTSYAKILTHLEQNEGSGIICETEADTLGNVFKQEWGSYSDLLRKTFHNERVSSSKKINNEFIEVNNPHMSVALSGTPNQVTGLIASAEDGLFSRFLFYIFKVEQKWKDVSPNNHKINLTEHFKNLSCQVLEMVTFLQNGETEIHLTFDQWELLNRECEKWLDDITMFTAEEAGSTVKRLGLIIYRIAVLFTAMRKFENGEVANQIYCSNDDFTVAVRLAETYLHHSILMFNNLPKQAESNQFKIGDSKRNFIEALPQEFTTKEATGIGEEYYLSYSTVTHLLPKLVPSHFSQPKAGYYIKNKI
jgi:hypothetical protein